MKKCLHLGFDDDDALANWRDVTNLLVRKSRISMEVTGGYFSCINGNNEQRNRSIHSMVSAGIVNSNQYEKWWCAADTSAEEYRYKIHSALENKSTHFAWYVKMPRIIWMWHITNYTTT